MGNGSFSVSGVSIQPAFTACAIQQAITPAQRAGCGSSLSRLFRRGAVPLCTSPRDVSEEFKGYGLLDINVRYAVPVFRSVRPWIKLDVYNIFNNTKLISWNTTVQQDPASQADALGLSTGYLKGAASGQMESNSNFPGPFNGATGGRTVLLALGVQF